MRPLSYTPMCYYHIYKSINSIQTTLIWEIVSFGEFFNVLSFLGVVTVYYNAFRRHNNVYF